MKLIIIFQISQKVRTNEPLLSKYKNLEKNVFNTKTMMNFRNFLNISLSLKIPDAATTNKRIYRGHNVPPPPPHGEED